MIAIARRNFSSLFLNPNVRFSPSIHHLSSSRLKILNPSPEIYDVLVHKHQFSAELASFAASHFPRCRSSERADSVVSLLKENSFTTAQLEKIVVYDPRVLGFAVESLKLKFKIFQDLGLSPEEIAKMMNSNTAILHSSVENRIIPALSLLKDLLGSNRDVARVIKKSSWVVTRDLERILIPNVEILKSFGAPMERIRRFLYLCPRCLLVKPDIMKKAVEKTIGIGISWSSGAFIRSIGVFACTSEGMLEVRFETFRDLGFSDDDALKILRKSPLAFSTAVRKMKNVTELVLATGKYNISNIVNNPTVLGYSVEKRLEPRLQVLGLLNSRNLIDKWPSLSFSALRDDRFFDTFIRPYYNEIGEEDIIKKYVEGKEELKL